MSVTDHTPRPIDKPVAASKPAAGKSVRWRMVLILVLPVAILAAALLAVLRFGDVDNLAAFLTRPALARATGVVTYNGQPLKNCQIITKPTGRGQSAIGWTDDEGKFSLKTDIRGERVDGVTVGEHLVAVSAYEPSSGPAAPRLLTPPSYGSVTTSPLRIVVGRDAEANEFQLSLEGDPPARPTGAGGRGKGGGKGKGKGGGGKATSPPASAAPTESAPGDTSPMPAPPAAESDKPAPSDAAPAGPTPADSAPDAKAPSDAPRGDEAPQ